MIKVLSSFLAFTILLINKNLTYRYTIISILQVMHMYRLYTRIQNGNSPPVGDTCPAQAAHIISTYCKFLETYTGCITILYSYYH